MEPTSIPTRTATVLLVGTEQMLLYTRKTILEKQNLAVSAAEPGKAAEVLRFSDFDVVITCHTLAPEEAESVAEAARSRPRAPGLIRFTKQPSPVAQSPFDAAVWSLSAPETLIDRVMAVLASRQN